MNMRSQYDLEIAGDAALATIERDVMPLPARSQSNSKREASA
jgi:hypothetical protein